MDGVLRFNRCDRIVCRTGDADRLDDNGNGNQRGRSHKISNRDSDRESDAAQIAVTPANVIESAVQGASNPAPTNVSLTNSGGKALNVSAVSDQPWLRISTPTATLPQVIQMAPSIAGLSAGTYTGHITFTASGSSSSTATLTVTLSISPPVPHQVDLSWNPSKDSTVVSYNVYRSTTSGAAYGLEASAITGSSYVDLAVQPGVTYYYVATAVNQQGEESSYSAETKATVP